MRYYRKSKGLRGNDTKERLENVPATDEPLTIPELARIKTYKFSVSSLLENFVQYILQFFYIEKLLT